MRGPDWQKLDVQHQLDQMRRRGEYKEPIDYSSGSAIGISLLIALLIGGAVLLWRFLL